MEKNEFIDLLNSKTNSRQSMQYRKSSKRQLQQTLLTCYSYERPCPPQIRVNHLGFQELRRSSRDALGSNCSDGGAAPAAYVRGGKIRGTAGGAA